MQLSIPQISSRPRAFIISVVFLMAILASLLPVAARFTVGNSVTTENAQKSALQESLRAHHWRVSDSSAIASNAGPDPSNSLAPQAQADFIRQISLVTNDVVYSPATQMLYASVPSSTGPGGNSITTI